MNNSQLKKCPLFAELIGWHLGDGCISISKNRKQYFLTGDLKEEQEFYNDIILPRFNNLFNNFLNRKVVLREYASIGVCGIYIFEKKFIETLVNEFNFSYGKKLNNFIPTYIKTNIQKMNLLRGLVDTDGSIYFCKSNYKTKNLSFHSIFHYKPKIKVATISKQLIYDVYNLLISLDFSPRLIKPRRQRPTESIMYGVVLDRKKDINKYIQEIGFNNPKHLTKIEVAKKFGFCPSKTNIIQRRKILNYKLSPLIFYENTPTKNLKTIKNQLNQWV